jgi:hypothetical protein
MESGEQIQEKIISFNVEVLQRAGKTQQINMTAEL